jgi:hypothetical protein
VQDRSSAEYQRLTWEVIRETVGGGASTTRSALALIRVTTQGRLSHQGRAQARQQGQEGQSTKGHRKARLAVSKVISGKEQSAGIGPLTKVKLRRECSA